MSGGSYEYLYMRDPEEMMNYSRREMLEKMEKDMRLAGKHAAADELFRYRLELETAYRHIQIRHKRLEHVMFEFEWWMSGDRSEDQFNKTWEALVKGTPTDDKL